MAQIDFSALGDQMLEAAKTALGNHYKSAKPFAEQSFKQLADNLKLIVRLKASNDITAEQAKLHFDIYKSTVRITLLTIEGLGLLAVEAAINAALGAVANVINTAIGFALI